MNRLAVLGSVVETIATHLAGSVPLEEGCFCLMHRGRGVSGTRYLVSEVILPPEGAWEIQARDQLRPSAKWLSAVISQAVRQNAGLLFVHSHPDPLHPPGFSPTDESASGALAEAIEPIIDGTFAVAVVHQAQWAAALPTKGALLPIERVVAVGRTLRLLGPTVNASAAGAALDDRQHDALGVVRHLGQGDGAPLPLIRSV